MLQQNPNEASVAALVFISQTLVTIATNNSLENLSNLALPQQIDGSEFIPSSNIIIVNILWCTSLALSIATAFGGMMVKDWCQNFLANRTGHPQDQALRRQRKWKQIERWKMQELIIFVPALLLMSL
ncbi:hypothetical protein FRC11_007901, partial [Ceratobasidium sp. 423]